MVVVMIVVLVYDPIAQESVGVVLSYRQGVASSWFPVPARATSGQPATEPTALAAVVVAELELRREGGTLPDPGVAT